MYFIDVNCLQFLASGFAFSAFPVLATLLNAMNLLNEPIGIQTISLAAVEDIVVWIVLAVASAFSSGGSSLQGLYTLLLTMAFIAIMIFIVRPIFNRIHDYYLCRDEDCNLYMVVSCFLLLVVAAFTTEVMGKYISYEDVKCIVFFRYSRVLWSIHRRSVYSTKG
jgi:Kef-type K+ transport system membrane component KefB